MDVFGYDAATAKDIAKKAKPRYRQIIAEVPEFEKGDRFKMNLVNCALVAAFILSMPQRPDVDRLTEYYARAMMAKYTEKDIAGMKKTAARQILCGNIPSLPAGPIATAGIKRRTYRNDKKPSAYADGFPVRFHLPSFPPSRHGWRQQVPLPICRRWLSRRK